MSTNTFKSLRLFNSSCPPAIQYSHSGEVSALVHKGSSSESSIGLMHPSARAKNISSVERELLRSRSVGMRW